MKGQICRPRLDLVIILVKLMLKSNVSTAVWSAFSLLFTISRTISASESVQMGIMLKVRIYWTNKETLSAVGIKPDISKMVRSQEPEENSPNFWWKWKYFSRQGKMTKNLFVQTAFMCTWKQNMLNILLVIHEKTQNWMQYRSFVLMERLV